MHVKRPLEIHFVYLDGMEVYCFFNTCCKIFLFYFLQNPVYCIISNAFLSVLLWLENKVLLWKEINGVTLPLQ